MNNTRWLGLIASLAFPLFFGYAQAPAASAPNGPEQAPAPAPVPANISPGTAEVVKLAESGVGEDVILAFIQNSKSVFNLAADDVFYLKDVGLTSPVITAMLNHDKGVGNQAPQYAPTPQPPVAPPASQPTAPPQAAPPPTYVGDPPVDVNYFYNDLSPYGTWVTLDGYGWCWQPRAVVINRGWRPYCDGGHWIDSDAGWCWQSDYSWGWAPFHYGRWYLHDRSGWVWVPDRVWGPAWVTWRVAGDNCGWAPLPPRATFEVGVGWRFNGVGVGVGFDFGLRPDHFTFVALGNFCDRDVRRRSLPVTEVRNIYKQTTIINNTTIVNRGVAVERVAAASHTVIRKAAIRDLPAGAGREVRMQGSVRNAPVVYRPQLTTPTKSEKIVAQKVDERHPVIQHVAIAPTTVERKSQAGDRGPNSINSAQRSQGQGQPNAGQNDSPRQNPLYYPKSYNQNSDGRSRSKSYDRQDNSSSRSGKDRPN